MTKILALTCAAALSFAACSSGSESDSFFKTEGRDEGTTTVAEPNPAADQESSGASKKSGGEASAGDFPAVEVIDVATEAKLQLTSLVPAEQPVLLWFWAPH